MAEASNSNVRTTTPANKRCPSKARLADKLNIIENALKPYLKETDPPATTRPKRKRRRGEFRSSMNDDETKEEIMGMPAKELFFLKNEEQDDEKFSKHILKLKVKEETFSDEQRVKSTVLKADRVNFSSEARFLVELMTKGKSDGSNAPFNAGNSYATGQPTDPAVNYGGETGLPANQAGAYGSQFGGSRYPMGNTSSNTFASCSSCGGSGHRAANCPSVNSGPGHLSGEYVGQTPLAPATGGGSGGECFKCRQTGHRSRDYPNTSGVTQSGFAMGGGGASGECFKCHKTEHWSRDCPSQGGVTQSGSVTTPIGGRSALNAASLGTGPETVLSTWPNTVLVA